MPVVKIKLIILNDLLNDKSHSLPHFHIVFCVKYSRILSMLTRGDDPGTEICHNPVYPIQQKMP
jgi:hypothetical protein